MGRPQRDRRLVHVGLDALDWRLNHQFDANGSGKMKDAIEFQVAQAVRKLSGNCALAKFESAIRKTRQILDAPSRQIIDNDDTIATIKLSRTVTE